MERERNILILITAGILIVSFLAGKILCKLFRIEDDYFENYSSIGFFAILGIFQLLFYPFAFFHLDTRWLAILIIIIILLIII